MLWGSLPRQADLGSVPFLVDAFAMIRSIRYACLASLVACATAPFVRAEPAPDPVPASWELKFDPSPMTRIQVDTGSGPRTYWYMLYTVTNNTGQDVEFMPEIVRVSEIESELPAEKVADRPAEAPTIRVEPSMVGLDSRIYQAIAQRHARTHPFLVTPVEAIGRLLQGKDNARSSVAVFKDLDPRVSRFTIYFGGLSGERKALPNPSFDARRAAAEQKSDGSSTGEEKTLKLFVLRKTLAIPFTLPGDVRTRPRAEPALGRMTWVMR